MHPSTFWHQECPLCGVCCTAPDIAALQKPLGVACALLDAECGCAFYQYRPQVCCSDTPDWVCGEVAPLPRLELYLEIYGLDAQAQG